MGKAVLVVDDDVHVRARIATFLEGTGLSIDGLDDPAQAYEACARDPARYGVVFMDIRFPDGDIGLQEAERIAAFRSEGGPRVVAMTGYSDLYDESALKRVGLNEILMKPLFKWLVRRLSIEACQPDAGRT